MMLLVLTCGFQSVVDNFYVSQLEIRKNREELTWKVIPLFCSVSIGGNLVMWLHECKKDKDVWWARHTQALLSYVARRKRSLKDRWLLHWKVHWKFTESKLIFKSLYCFTSKADMNTQSPKSLCFFHFVGSISISKQLASMKGKTRSDWDVCISPLPWLRTKN